MCGIDLSPGIDYGHDLDGSQIGESQVVGRGEGQDVALASYGLGLQEALFDFWDSVSTSLVVDRRRMRTVSIAAVIRSLLLLHGTVVVDKDKGAVVLRVGVTLGTLVAGAQVALGIIVGQRGL